MAYRQARRQRTFRVARLRQVGVAGGRHLARKAPSELAALAVPVMCCCLRWWVQDQEAPSCTSRSISSWLLGCVSTSNFIQYMNTRQSYGGPCIAHAGRRSYARLTSLPKCMSDAPPTFLINPCFLDFPSFASTQLLHYSDSKLAIQSYRADCWHIPSSIHPCSTMEDDETVGAGLYPSIGSTKAQHKIFYINPNSTDDMTAEAADYFEDKISPDICVSFYTAPPQAPPSINGTLDAVMSTAVVLEDLGLSSHNPKERAKVLASTFSAVIVGCFSAHPLLPALQEALHFQDSAPPVIGIMEAAIYTALQLAPSFGIVTTGLSESTTT